MLYNGSMTRLLQYPSKKTNQVFYVPDSVNTVSGDAFDHTSHLTKLYFGKNLRSLPDDCIYMANHLKSVIFHANARKMHYGSYAISECSKLAVIVGPNTYTMRAMARNANATLITL